MPRGKPIQITKTGSFRDLIRPPKPVKTEVGLDLLTGKFEVKRRIPIKEPFIQFKISRQFEAPSEFQPTPPVTLEKRAGPREAFRFLTQPPPREDVTLRIPKLRIQLGRKIIGPGIGFGDVTVKRLNLGLIDIRLVKFGHQRLIDTVPKPKVKELEFFFKTGFILRPTGEGVVLGKAFPSGRQLILSKGKLPKFIKIEKIPLVVPKKSIIELGEPKKTIKEVEIETRGNKGTQLLIQKTEQVTKSVSKQRQQQKQLLKQKVKLKDKQLLGQGKLIIVTPGLEGLQKSTSDILSGNRFDSLKSVILGQQSKQKQSQKLVLGQQSKQKQSQKLVQELISRQDLISRQELGQVQIPVSLQDFRTTQVQAQLQDLVQRQEQVTEQETITRPPPPPPIIGFPFIPSLFLGEGIRRGKRPLPKEFAFTPDFIASVRDEFGPAPKQAVFTGQERRFKIRGRRFVSPLPKVRDGGIFGIIRNALAG